MYNAGYDLGGDVQAYSFGSYGHRKASAFENFRLPSKVIADPAPAAATTVPFPHGFSPREQIVEDDFHAGTLGIRGVVADWNWDLSTTYGHDSDDVSTINSANASLFADTGASPRNFFDGTFAASEWTTTLDIDRAFDARHGRADERRRWGAENRESKFAIGAGRHRCRPTRKAASPIPGFQKTDAGTHTRTNYKAGLWRFVALVADRQA